MGTLVAAIIFILLFSALNAPQCPESYTQKEIDATGCIVGANIGIGLLVVSLPMLWAVSVYVTGIVLKPRAASKDKN